MVCCKEIGTTCFTMFHVFFKVLQQYTSTLLNRNDYRTWISSKARIRESVLLLLQPRGPENALNKAVGLITRGTSGATEGRLESEINGGGPDIWGPGHGPRTLAKNCRFSFTVKSPWL